MTLLRACQAIALVAIFAAEALGQSLEDDIRVPPTDLVDSQYQLLKSEPTKSSAQVLSDEIVEISLLLLHDPGMPDATAVLEGLVETTNSYYAESGVLLRFNLVAIAPLAMQAGSNSNYLNRLTLGSGTQESEELAALRDTFGADMASYIRAYDGGSSCGTAWLIGSGFTPSASYTKRYTISVVMEGQLGNSFCGDDSLAHELGHNFGVVHDLANSGSPPRFPYGYGYGVSGQFGTIMSYIFPSAGYFSNPQLSTCNGFACGRSGMEDVVRAINEVRGEFAAVYPDVTVPETPDVGSVESTVTSLSIQVLPAGDGGAPLDSYAAYCDGRVAENTEPVVTISGLEPDRQYSCTVSTRNAIGESPRSSSVLSRTNAIPPVSIIRTIEGDEEVTLRVSSADPQGAYTILGYIADCDGVSAESSAETITLQGLENERSYACSVVVSTSVGQSAASPTVSATPLAIVSGLSLPLLKAAVDRNSSN